MKRFFNVIGTSRKNGSKIIIEPHLTEAQAMKMCESWGWMYDDGTDKGTYCMDIEEEISETFDSSWIESYDDDDDDDDVDDIV